MERTSEQIAILFKQLEDAVIIAKREYDEIDSQYREIVAAREEACRRWKKAQRAFDFIDAIQELVEEKEEETSE